MTGVIRKLVFLLWLLCLGALAVTGFVPLLSTGGPVSGYWLMVHVTAGGVFAGCMAVLAVLLAENNRLNKSGPRGPGPVARVCFWAVLVLSLPVILSSVLSMFKLLGTDWQKLLLQIHLYSTIVLSLFAVVYLFLAAISGMKKTTAN